MRTQIINTILRRMGENKDIFFLTGDMGINLVEKIEESYPDRFLNVGIAEQNLIGVAAGLANLGYRPFAYTISNFITHRCYEQIRNEIGIHQYPITLLGTSTGYDNAPLGPTHHIIDDWGAVKNIPGIDIYCPASISYAETLVDNILKKRTPAYIRIPKGEFALPKSTDHAVLVAGEKKKVLLVTYGSLVQDCLAAQEVDPTLAVLVLNRLRSLDSALLEESLRMYRHVLVVEDHFPQTGLYNSLCEYIMRKGIIAKLLSLAPDPEYTLQVGVTPQYFHKKYGLDCQGIGKAISTL